MHTPAARLYTRYYSQGWQDNLLCLLRGAAAGSAVAATIVMPEVFLWHVFFSPVRRLVDEKKLCKILLPVASL
jgi:hypothetical protein